MRSVLIDGSAVSAGPCTLVIHGSCKHSLCPGVTLPHVKIINTQGPRDTETGLFQYGNTFSLQAIEEGPNIMFL